LRLDGEFIARAALFAVDRTLSHPPHLFNGTKVRDFGRSMKIGAGHCDTDCVVSFFRLSCLMK
jgi:hypothetical protein